jgi:hypothetical protein
MVLENANSGRAVERPWFHPECNGSKMTQYDRGLIPGGFNHQFDPFSWYIAFAE